MDSVLTIGMATYGEFDSVWFTLQGLSANHPKVNYLVVDNTPERDQRIESAVRAVGGDYYHRPDLNGTSKPRDAVFRFAKTEWAMCIDSHVLLETGAVRSALDWIEAHPQSSDLVQGPLVYDDGKGVSTHWNRPTQGLWGTWDRDERYQQKEPFEIEQMGLGLWLMRKAAWVGFNPLFRGFGGEEGYTHQKVRNRGGKCLCLPQLRWRHKFRDITGWNNNPPPPYPLRLEDHCWNLLVGHRELGIEATEAIYDHFGSRLSAEQWEQLKAEAERKQPFGKEVEQKRLNLLGIWYSDCSAPTIQKSAHTVKAAAKQTRNHSVTLSAVTWQDFPANPFDKQTEWQQFAGEKVKSHSTILKQIEQAVQKPAERLKQGWSWNGTEWQSEFDAVVFLEHDVLYPEDYFDRIGDTLAANPTAPVVSNLDYMGLNATGWQRVRERHEPLHQLTVRWDHFQQNLRRAKADCQRQGWCLLEPDSEVQRQVLPEYAEVVQGLFIGQQVPQPPKGVTAVLSLMGVDDNGQPDPYATDPRLAYKHSPISDHHEKPAPTLDWLKEQVEWVEQRRAAGDSVFVHCLGGVSRSGLVTVAYLMKSLGVTKEAALALVREVRPQVAPRPAFWQLLTEYQKALPSVQKTASRPSNRSNWIRLQPVGSMPSVHINYPPRTEGQRFTSHGDVCYEPVGYSRWHSHWGPAENWFAQDKGFTPPPPVKTKQKAATCKENKVGCGCSADALKGVEELAAEAAANPSDFHQHVPYLKELATKCQSATELSLWFKAADTAVCAGLPATGTFTSVCSGTKPSWNSIRKSLGDRFRFRTENPATAEIEETDLLFIDTEHTADALLPLLQKHHSKVAKYLVVHCTAIYGEKGDRDNRLGVLHALRTFCRDNPNWVVKYQTEENNGLLVLSKCEEDVKEKPSLWKQGLNYAKAMAKHLSAGRPLVSLEVLKEREAECALCTYRSLDACSACGCPLTAKLPMALEQCGLVKLGQEPKWDAVTDKSKWQQK